MLLRHIVAGMAVVAFGGPVAWLLVVSIMPRRALFRSPPSVVFEPTAQHLSATYVQGTGLRELAVSITTAVTGAGIAIGLAAMFVLPRLIRYGRPPRLMGVLLPMYGLPSSLMAVPFFVYVTRLGVSWWISYVAALAAAALIVAILLLSGYLGDLRVSAVDSLLVHEPDQAWRHVRVVGHDARAVIWIGMLFAFLVCWHDLVFGAVLASGTAPPLNVSVLGLVTPVGTYWGQIAARAWPSVMVAVAFALMANERVMRGFLLGR